MYGEIIFLSIAVQRFDSVSSVLFLLLSSFLLSCLSDYFGLWIHFNCLRCRRWRRPSSYSLWIHNPFHSIPFHSTPFDTCPGPRTTKWYTTIKQFKFISVCDQFYVQVSHFVFFPSVVFSSVARVIIVIVTICSRGTRRCVCPGIFIADFPSICAYCFHSSAVGSFFPFWNFLREMVHFPSHSMYTTHYAHES